MIIKQWPIARTRLTRISVELKWLSDDFCLWVVSCEDKVLRAPHGPPWMNTETWKTEASPPPHLWGSCPGTPLSAWSSFPQKWWREYLAALSWPGSQLPSTCGIISTNILDKCIEKYIKRPCKKVTSANMRQVNKDQCGGRSWIKEPLETVNAPDKVHWVEYFWIWVLLFLINCCNKIWIKQARHVKEGNPLGWTVH